MLINITNEEFRKIIADVALEDKHTKSGEQSFYKYAQIMIDPEDGLDDSSFSGGIWLQLLKHYQVEQS